LIWRYLAHLVVSCYKSLVFTRVIAKLRGHLHLKYAVGSVTTSSTLFRSLHHRVKQLGSIASDPEFITLLEGIG